MTDQSRVDPSLLHEQAQTAVLDALLRGDDVDAVVAAVAPYDVRGKITPDVAMLELAVDAFDLADTPSSEMLEYEGLRERYLPEIEFYGRTEQRNSQYAATPPPASAADCDRTCSTTPAGGVPGCGSTPPTH